MAEGVGVEPTDALEGRRRLSGALGSPHARTFHRVAGPGRTATMSPLRGRALYPLSYGDVEPKAGTDPAPSALPVRRSPDELHGPGCELPPRRSPL